MHLYWLYCGDASSPHMWYTLLCHTPRFTFTQNNVTMHVGLNKNIRAQMMIKGFCKMTSGSWGRFRPKRCCDLKSIYDYSVARVIEKYAIFRPHPFYAGGAYSNFCGALQLLFCVHNVRYFFWAPLSVMYDCIVTALSTWEAHRFVPYHGWHQ